MQCSAAQGQGGASVSVIVSVGVGVCGAGGTVQRALQMNFLVKVVSRGPLWVPEGLVCIEIGTGRAVRHAGGMHDAQGAQAAHQG